MPLQANKNIYKKTLTILFLGTFISSQTVLADNVKDNCVIHNPKNIEKPDNNDHVGDIYLCINDVFNLNNPEENKLLFKAANILHIKTKPKYIAEQLLFIEGEAIDERIISESERNIRNNDYIREANISLKKDPENPDQSNIYVETYDAWTTKPTFSFKRSGGVTSSSIGLREDNLMGQGIRLSVKQNKDFKRDSTEFKYSDETAFGSDKSLNLDYSNNSDGYIKYIQFEKPYLSLEDNKRFGFLYNHEDKTNSYYILGEEAYSFQNNSINADIYLGLSKGFYKGRTIRHQFGLENYSTVTDSQNNVANFTNSSVLNLTEQDSTAPYYEYQLIEDRYKKVYNRRAIGKSEDQNYGYEFQVRLGFPINADSTNKTFSFQKLSLSKAFEINDSSEFAVNTSLNLKQYTQSENEVMAAYEMEYFKSQSHKFKLYSSLQLNHGYNLSNGRQVVLDNLNGLRGYPINHLTGTQSALFTIEERFYYDKDIWQIINMGGAIFFDIGSISGEENLDQLDINYFRSFGIGLRFSSNRSSDSSVLHIDYAKPIDAHNGSRSFQFSIEVKDKF
jgi:hypothetical protein